MAAAESDWRWLGASTWGMCSDCEVTVFSPNSADRAISVEQLRKAILHGGTVDPVPPMRADGMR